DRGELDSARARRDLVMGGPRPHRVARLLSEEIDVGGGAPALLRLGLRRGRGERVVLRDPRRPHRAALGRAHAAGFRVSRQGVGAGPRVAEVTAPVAVFRLHGRNAEGWLRQVRGEEPAVREKYDYLYSEPELRELMPEIDEAAGEAEQVYVSFNNNNRDYPVRNALMLRKMLGQPVAGGQSLPGDLFA